MRAPPASTGPRSHPHAAGAGARRASAGAAAAALVVLLCALVSVVALAAPPPSAKLGCVQGGSSLILNEVQVGIGAKPRWLEIANPGAAAVALTNVVVRVSAKGIAGAASDETGVLEFAIGETVGELPAGEVLLVGHLPSEPGSNGAPGPYFGLKMLDLGAAFVLPVCNVKLEILSPYGPLDAFSYTLCQKDVPPATDAVWQTVLSLDPSHGAVCDNDAMSTWCETTAAGSPAKPTPGKINDDCDLDGDGYTLTTGDCDDGNLQVSPIALEACNGKDDDCDGETDESVIAPAGTCLSLGVCAGPLADGSPVAWCDGKNGFACSYPVGYESVNETLCDGFDNDCDGQTDEGLQNACGGCGPPPAELCNGKDDDCDGQTDEAPDLSAQQCAGVGVCAQSSPYCGPSGPACTVPAAYEATETLCDGADNDCDGQTDEELGLGQPCVAGTGLCAAEGYLACAPDAAVRCVAVTSAPGDEICGNNKDDDCDGQTDEDFGVGEQCTVGLGVCRVFGKRVCRDESDGRPSTSSICLATPTQPTSAELCGNDLDDDCDGFVDEPGCVDPGAKQGACSASPGGRPWQLAPLLLALCALALARRQRPAARA